MINALESFGKCARMDMFFYLSKASREEDYWLDHAEFCGLASMANVGLGSLETTAVVETRLRRLQQLKRCG
jgi:hypothetical protein